MRVRPAAWFVLIALAGCGGADREEFTREASAACRETERVEASSPGEQEMARAYAQEIERLEALEPPEEDAGRFREMIRLKADTAEAWGEFVVAREERDLEATDALMTRMRQSAVDAAQIAGDLGIEGCSSALF